MIELIQDHVDSIAAADTNRPMNQLLEQSGYQPDGSDFAGFSRLNYPILDGEEGVVNDKYPYGDIRRYGALGDALTTTLALRQAIIAATAVAGLNIFIPNGIWYYYPQLFENRMIVPIGTTLYGEGFGSVLTVDPNSFTQNNSTWWTLFFDTDSRCTNLRLNGNKDNINTTGLTSIQFFGFTSLEGANDVRFDHLWCHDGIGLTKESFAVSAHGEVGFTGSKRIILASLTAWNWQGTPFQLAGQLEYDGVGDPDYTWHSTKMVSDCIVTNCIAWNCTWHGLSIFSSFNCVVRDCQFNDNDQNGLNTEWVYGIDVYSTIARRNGYAGFGSFGGASVNYWNCISELNNTLLNADKGELDLHATTYHLGSPAPKAVPIEIHWHRGSIVPQDSYPHVAYPRDVSINVGLSVPTLVELDHLEAHHWLIRIQGGGSRKDVDLFTGFRFPQVITQRRIIVGNLLSSSWSVSANMARAAYMGAEALGPNAVTLTASATNASLTNASALLFAGRRYRIRFKVITHDSTRWYISAKNGSTFPQIQYVPEDTELIGVIQTLEHIFVCTDTNKFTPIITCSGIPSGTSVLDISEVTFDEISEGLEPSLSDSFGPLQVTYGIAAPTIGTWAVGDIRWNTAPVTGGPWGWRCITAGTPGTWEQIQPIPYVVAMSLSADDQAPPISSIQNLDIVLVISSNAGGSDASNTADGTWILGAFPNGTWEGQQLTIRNRSTSRGHITIKASGSSYNTDMAFDIRLRDYDTAIFKWTTVAGTGRWRIFGLTRIGNDKIDVGYSNGKILNADVSLQSLVDASNLVASTTMTADRTVTLVRSRALVGDRFRIKHAASGGFNLLVKTEGASTLKSIANGIWAEFVFDGSNWTYYIGGTY